MHEIPLLFIKIELRMKFHHPDPEKSLTKYVTPSSVPVSHGYRFSTLDSTQEQFLRHNSRLETPTIQSGEGSIIETSDMRW